MAPIFELLWQWSGLALVTWFVLRALRWSGASVRYAVLWASAATAVLLPLLRRMPADPVPAAAGTAGPASSTLQFALPSSLDSWLLPVLLTWGLVSALLLVRLGGRVRATVRLRRRCAPASEALLARLEVPIGRRGYAGELLLCDDVAIPSVLGFSRPAIVMSRRLAEGLSDEELDQIVLHEWAHIMRRDQWARLAQGVLECFAYFHPATWWLTRTLDRERELACDEWVTSQTRAPRIYASALAAVAGLLAGSQKLGTAPQTGTSRSEIVRRVERLLRREKAHRMPAPWAWAAALLLFTAGASAVHRLTPAFETEDVEAGQEAGVPATFSEELKPAAAALLPTPQQPARRARGQARAKAAPGAALRVAEPAAGPSEGIMQTDIGAVDRTVLNSQPRSIRLDAVVSDTALFVSSPAVPRQDRAWGVDASGFRSLGAAMVRGGKGTGGFFQKLAQSARETF